MKIAIDGSVQDIRGLSRTSPGESRWSMPLRHDGRSNFANCGLASDDRTLQAHMHWVSILRLYMLVFSLSFIYTKCYSFAFSDFEHAVWVAPSLRVLRAETRLTVYRPLQVDEIA